MKNSGYIFPLGLLLANCELKISIANRAWSTIFEFMITTGLVRAIFDYNNKYLNVPCGLIIQFMVVLHPMIKNWLSCKKSERKSTSGRVYLKIWVIFSETFKVFYNSEGWNFARRL